MTRLIAVALVVLALLIAASPVGASTPLTTTPYCVQADGTYAALVTGTGSSNQSIDWSPNSAFNPSQSSYLEGDSGMVGLTVAGYPNGVWVRWTLDHSVVTHMALPSSCDPWAVPFATRPASGPINLSGTACNGITISNLTFANLGAGVRAITLTNCTNVVIEQVDFLNVAEGVVSHGGSNITVRDSRYQNIIGPAHDASGNRTANLANFVQFDNSNGVLVDHNKGKCGDTEDIVSFTGSTRNATASNNQFEGALSDSPGCLAWKSNSGSGIAVADGSADNNVARNNIVLNPGQVGIFINGGTNSHIDDNIVIGQQRPGSNVGIYVSSSGCGHTVLRDRVFWRNASGAANGWYRGGSCVPDTSGSNFNDTTLDPNAYHVQL